ncbi:MAG: cytochrome c [Rhodospirillaceae bacterium]|jgi:mono/diheme cytochrome c family protein|nr:cytochrome c [Rhodospirillaceae bacterium]MBT3932333.1 cytochrome c [Rhodospirillaceae bacterium]MBT4771840.1 cytochrome c [Rhodospirillaceae bacterium]MBT5358643.1 cytochrome c [Rhodospirillaceae bacterium]MBT5768735.1 cytochrome c [Rhodospirillaceae bacterium]
MKISTFLTAVPSAVPSAVLAAFLVVVGLGAPHASAETLLERGTYLMESIVACGNCHTPQGPNGPIAGKNLAGGLLFEEPGFVAVSSNITPDRETGIGSWSDAQIIASIREGKRPDGSTIGPPMPIGMYRGLSDWDAQAIVAYLRTVKPVRNVVAKSKYEFPLPPAYGPPVGSVPNVPRDDRVAYGAYLAGPAGHCMECHTPFAKPGMRDFENKLGAGGAEFHGPWGTSVSADITPTALADRSYADIKARITTGTRADGARMAPPMAYPFYANITEEDLQAIVAYLRTLPAK